MNVIPKKMVTGSTIIFSLFLLCPGTGLYAGDQGQTEVLTVKNNRVACSVHLRDGRILYDRIKSLKPGGGTLSTDAGFGLNFMWTGWRAPGKANNGDNPVVLTKKDFKVTRSAARDPEAGQPNGEIELLLKGDGMDLEVKILYSLGKDDFYVRRKIALRDAKYHKHFLRKISALDTVMISPSAETHLIKEGGFGQPIALKLPPAGAFFGMEYPAAQNHARLEDNRYRISCSQMIGKKIGQEWLESQWTVAALTPDSRVKYWFFNYLHDIRVAPLKPYTLYNSWYDLRAVDYPSKEPTKENNVMNEKNVMRMIGLVRENMIEKHGIKMDAFVLDDGWDVYKSDWELRKEQFPNGMKPIADELKKTGTDLGIWFGPTGGYSARMQRVNWMKAHGYETVGQEKSWHNEMLCLGGKKYGELFKKRAVDFVKNDGVGFFKWDGIQFSCSEPDHGHAIGIYSRRAVLDTLIGICRAVQKANPRVFLNITSGTWLSPWWLKYTNQIWMDGRDYAHSDVPSISPRDSAITYRDFVLYEDFKNKDLWFPIANLMTHGIIKGHLQKLGGEAEPIDKFTDNALLYFARGVSMWELYISPDLLTPAEWNAIGKSITWAKERFPVLTNTRMIGGDPAQRATYGYVHFKGKRGIIAARNPYVEPRPLEVKLDPHLGLDPGAASLVLERVYPTRWISPQIYSAGAAISLPLNGYETAVYELYPLAEATEPLLADVVFEPARTTGGAYALKAYDIGPNPRLLNPEKVRKIHADGKKDILLADFNLPSQKMVQPVTDIALNPGGKKQPRKKGKTLVNAHFTMTESSRDAVLAVLLQHKNKSGKKSTPVATIRLNGKKTVPSVEKVKGMWVWYTVPLSPGAQKADISITPAKGKKNWKGKVSLWVVCRQKHKSMDISFKTAGKTARLRSFPPAPWSAGETVRNVKLGEVEVH